MKDKKYHVLAGVLAAAFIGLPAYLESLNLFAGLWSAIVSGILLAGCKEYCDMRTEGNNWDWWDFGCTCIGAVIVAVFIILLHYGKGLTMTTTNNIGAQGVSWTVITIITILKL